jgi:hypothetical protein
VLLGQLLYQSLVHALGEVALELFHGLRDLGLVRSSASTCSRTTSRGRRQRRHGGARAGVLGVWAATPTPDMT